MVACRPPGEGGQHRGCRSAAKGDQGRPVAAAGHRRRRAGGLAVREGDGAGSAGGTPANTDILEGSLRILGGASKRRCIEWYPTSDIGGGEPHAITGPESAGGRRNCRRRARRRGGGLRRHVDTLDDGPVVRVDRPLVAIDEPGAEHGSAGQLPEHVADIPCPAAPGRPASPDGVRASHLCPAPPRPFRAVGATGHQGRGRPGQPDSAPASVEAPVTLHRRGLYTPPAPPTCL